MTENFHYDSVQWLFYVHQIKRYLRLHNIKLKFYRI